VRALFGPRALQSGFFLMLVTPRGGAGGEEGSAPPPRPGPLGSAEGRKILVGGEGIPPLRALASFPPVFIGVNPNAIISHRMVFSHHIACETCDKKKSAAPDHCLVVVPGVPDLFILESDGLVFFFLAGDPLPRSGVGRNSPK